MSDLIKALETLEETALGSLVGASDVEGLGKWRLEVLGRRGSLAETLKGLGTLTADQRPKAGQVANRVKASLEATFAARLEAIQQEVRRVELGAERLDVTLPASPRPRGSLHPVTKIRREIEEAFARLGFTSVEGPEVEWDQYNFTMLNIPPDHPARDTQDSFYIEGGSGCFFARKPHRYRYARCWRTSHRSASLPRGEPTGTKRQTRHMRPCSRRWRASALTGM